MLYTFGIYFALFMIYAVAGWIMEVTLFLCQEKKFINRGFLIGPYCPIYGVCCLLMIATFQQYSHSPLTLFVMAAVLCTVVEYLTSVVMEKLFDTRWWDYSQVPFNINGRVCLHNSVIFGVLGFILVYSVNPILEQALRSIPSDILLGFSLASFVLFLADNITSFNLMARMKWTAHSIVNKESTEEITEKLKEFLRNKSIFSRRLLYAFPDFRSLIKEKIKIRKF